MSHAPIALFAYKRVAHLQQTISALEKADGFSETKVFVFSDGPKSSADQEDVDAVRRLLSNWGKPNVTVVEAESNIGLSRSIRRGVTRLCDEYGSVIVIEDDILIHDTALKWLNEGLVTYANDRSAFSITAYQYRIPEFAQISYGIQAPFISSWGWATWKRAWDLLEPEIPDIEALAKDRRFVADFNLDNTFPMFQYLRASLNGKHDSWAARWYWALYKHKGFTVFPPRSLVQNIGQDSTATNPRNRLLSSILNEPEPFMWRGEVAPKMPTKRLNQEHLRAFRRGLKRTGAMRNARLRALAQSVINGSR